MSAVTVRIKGPINLIDGSLSFTNATFVFRNWMQQVSRMTALLGWPVMWVKRADLTA